MKILMLTNTYLPHVGGVARSVQQFAAEFRDLGHKVLVVAPSFDDDSDQDDEVVRVPAIKHFGGSSFSIPLPIPGLLSDRIDAFQPELIHSHHPFLLGDTALRIASSRNLPLVFTNHTVYAKYAHYVVSNSEALKAFVTDLATGYCNLCDAVVAPSSSIKQMLIKNGVERPIEVIPTGVDLKKFTLGDRKGFRENHAIPDRAFLVGHVGRLAPEKSIAFLAEAVAEFVASNKRSWFLVAGTGPCDEEILSTFIKKGVADRLVILGELPSQELVDAYYAMDTFAFASLSETQGMVVTEAMAAGTPVVAIDGPGVREAVRNGMNGLLLPTQEVSSFSAALRSIESLGDEALSRMKIG
ncbi:MAG: glycosyltransferase, partial [Lacipirellulaceae bacterium]